ncbi:MAG: hypothetical protein QOJ89_49 [bacterium]
MASSSLSDHVFVAAIDADAPRWSRSCRLWATELPFLVCALAALEWLPAQRALNPLVCLVLVAGFAQASSVGDSAHGTGWAPSAQLAFVPMLFFAPLNLVPLMVLASYLATDILPCLGRGRRAGRRVLCLGDGWWTLGPVLVLGAANHATFAWAHWPVYAVALAAQLALSALFACLRVRLHDGERLALRDVAGLPTVIDIVLTLPALSIAAAAGDAPIGAALTWAALLAIAAGILSERGERSPSPIEEPASSRVTPCVATRPPVRLPPRASGSPAFAPRWHTPSAEAAVMSRRSSSCGASRLAAQSKLTHDRRYSTTARA